MWTHKRERYGGDQDLSFKYVELKVPVSYIGKMSSKWFEYINLEFRSEVWPWAANGEFSGDWDYLKGWLCMRSFRK